MTRLRKIMLEELQRRNFAKSTIQYYLQAMEDFATYFHKPPDQLTPDHLRQYQAYLLTERKLQPCTARLHVCALRFFFRKTLMRPLPPDEGGDPDWDQAVLAVGESEARVSRDL